MKLKTLLQTFVFSHVYRIARALARAKSVLIQLLKDVHKNKNSKQKKLFFGSFRLHYNWGSSNSNPYVYYDSSWDSVIGRATTLDYDEIMQECNSNNNNNNNNNSELSKYLQWLEEKGGEKECCNEIDKLADLFIADCHEKFRLEKQESYRRFQEMMARSV
ncbi:hypothetical protein PHJA_002688200 [Phtheirospermum japonicum]|uniref:Uncharacterized protein n=1 Tax=Phtheirospermum japonicum TaxID=374723 RepID=A0A830CZQ2_9LAMI|nr:hypothetical protein PHJA_002688200 [Phtheirospermum japonicum]